MKQKNKKWYLLVPMIAVIYLVIYLNDDTHVGISDELKDEIVSKYDGIRDIDILGNSTTLFISYEAMEDIKENEIKEVFLKTREIISNDEVFQKLVQYHDSKYGGTIIELHISFRYGEDNGSKSTDFYSYSEVGEGSPQSKFFQNWYVKTDGKSVKYSEQ